jgi:hypothetical protein
VYEEQNVLKISGGFSQYLVIKNRDPDPKNKLLCLQVFELVWGSLDYHIYMAAILPFLLALVAIR